MAGAQGQPDETLVSQARAGSKRAFGELVERETGRLLALATRMLASASQAEDVVQDSLASVWLTRHRLDAAKPIGPYLTTVVLNRCRDRLRRRKVVRFFGLAGDDELHAIADDVPGPEAAAASREELKLVQAEIARMPVRLREALVLVSIEGRSQAEAAELLGTTEKAVETRVYRARNRLKERFGNL